MVDIRAETFAKNCIHTISQLKRSKESILWLRIQDIGKELDVKNIFDLVDKEIRRKFETNYPTEQQIRKYKRHGSEFIKDVKFMYAHECIIISITMHCRVATSKSIEFRSKLAFNQYDITLTKEQSVLKSIMDAFEGENMQTPCNVLGYRIYLHFHDYKLAVETDEKGHKDRNIYCKIKKKALQKELSCAFIRINPDEKVITIFKTTNEIHR